jgi:hypothetical protein
LLVGETGVPVSGATIDLIVTHAGFRDSSSTRTDGLGLFSVRLPAQVGQVDKVSLRVSAAGYPGYVVDSLACYPTGINGNACVLDPIVPVPWVPTHFVFLYRNSDRVPIPSAKVTFSRTGGAAWIGPEASEVFRSTLADPAGVDLPFPQSLYASSLDPVVGDLIVEMPAPFGTSVIHGYQVRPTYFFADRPVAVIWAGPNLSYRLAFFDSVTQRPVEGLNVGFQRTGGIDASPASFQGVTDTTGSVVLGLRPLATGSLTGILTATSNAASQPVSISGIGVTTFDSDSMPLLGRWLVGRAGALYPLPPNP